MRSGLITIPIKIVTTKYEGGHKLYTIDQISDKNYSVPSELLQPIRKGWHLDRPLALPGHFTGVCIFTWGHIDLVL